MSREFPEPWMLKESTDQKTTRRPQCIAHRGYQAHWPENTMQAFIAAVSAGAQAIETDVHLTKDNHVVLSHDSSLKRCYGVDRLISDCTLNEVDGLRTLREPHLPMPSLREFLVYMNQGPCQDVWILLDLKIDDDPDLLLTLVSDVIAESCKQSAVQWQKRILLGCWTEEHMILCAKYLPNFSVAYLAYSTTYTGPVFRHRNVSCVAVQMTMSFWPAGTQFLSRMHAANRPIMAWMANNEKSWKWCIDSKLQGVVVNDPRRFLELCKNTGVEKPVGVGLMGWIVGLGIYIIAGLYGLFIFERPRRRRRNPM